MPKLFYPTPDQLQGARPLNENQWFRAYQPLLLKLANTDYGRDLLQIEPRRKRPEPIVAIQKNMVRRYLGRADDKHYFQSDFRVGAKWGNVIRYRWLEVKAALDQLNARELFLLPKYILVPNGRWVPLVAGATVTTVYPQPDPETVTVDGEVYRDVSQPGESWATLRAGAAVTAAPSSATFRLYQVAANTADQYLTIIRTIVLYDASSIPDTDSIDSANISFYATASTDQITSALVANVVSSSPASNTNVVLGDYATATYGTVKFTAGLSQASWVLNAYNDLALNTDGLNNISKTGVSKFGLRSEHDIDNVAPGGPFTGTATDTITISSADTIDTTQDPKLTVTHTAAATFVPRLMIF